MKHISDLQALAVRAMGSQGPWIAVEIAARRVECEAYRNPSIAFRKPVILFRYRVDGVAVPEVTVSELIRRSGG